MNTNLLKVKYSEAVKAFKEAGHVLHHTACHPGYVTRKPDADGDEVAFAEAYAGKFGKGFRVHRKYLKSGQFHVVEYWIKEENNADR